YSLHPLFKLAAVFCSGHERSEVEGHYPFAKENARYFLLNNPEGQTFSYSGLTNTRFTDQYRVVLLSPGKDLSYAFNFFFAAHDGIQFIVFRQTGKVATKVIEHRRAGLFSALLFLAGCTGAKYLGRIFVRVV